MTKEKLQAILDTMPAGSLVYLRRGDDAWPAQARRFKEGGNLTEVLYLEVVPEDEDGDHRNFPEGYNGVTEVPIATG
jgi:hypothetical protein